MSYQVDSYGNAYFPAGVSVKSIPATTGTQAKVLVPGANGRISSATIAQLVTQSGGNIVSSVFGRTGVVVAKEGDYNTDQITESGGALYFSTSRARKSIFLTTFNTSGPATYDTNTGILNIPQYGSGAASPTNFVPLTRTITINGQTADLSVDRIFSVASMVYPSAGIALSNGVSWEPSITNNSANWNTAFSWGNHALGGYVTLSSTQTITGTKTFSSAVSFSDGYYAAFLGQVVLNHGLSFSDTGNAAIFGNAQAFSVTRSSNTSQINIRRDNAVEGGPSYTQSLNFANNIESHIYTFPSLSGTIALTSNLSSYVPYTGATANVNLGAHGLQAGNRIITGRTTTDAGGSFVMQIGNGTNYVGDANSVTMYAPSASQLMFIYKDASVTKLVSISPNQPDNSQRYFSWPSVDGQLALVSQLPSLAAYVPYNGATTALDLGNNKLIVGTGNGTTNSHIDVFGDLNNTYLNLESAGYQTIYYNGYYKVIGKQIGYQGTRTINIASSPVTGTNFTINFPNASGTLALTSDIVTYTLPTASTSVLGGVKVDGSTITADVNGVISGANTYSLPTATSTILGGVKIGAGVTITSGVISVSTNYEAPITAGTTSEYWRGDKSWQTLPVYTLSGLGGQAQLNGTGFVKASGTTITYDNSTYYLSSNPSGYITGYTETDTLSSVTARGASTSTAVVINNSLAVNHSSHYDSAQFSLDVNGGLLVKNVGKTALFLLINSNPATGGNNAFVQHTVGGTLSSSFATIQGYYGASVTGSTVLKLNPLGGDVLIGTLIGTGTRMVVADANGVVSTQAIPSVSTVAWTSVTGRPTALSQFTNDLGNYGGWITSYTETDTLGSVTARGATTSTALTLSSQANNFGGHHYFIAYDAAGNHYPHYQNGSSNTGAIVNTRVYTGSGASWRLFVLNGQTAGISWDGNVIYHAGNIPTWNQNTTGTAANITATTNSTLTTLSSLSLPYSQLSGTVPTWNQNTTGNAATASSTALVTIDNSVAYGRSGLQFAQSANTAGNTASNHNTPTGDWWHVIRMNHANGAGYYADLAVSMTTNLGLSRRVISNGTQLSNWVTILDALNYNTYAPTLTGTGASGTWGINVTGTAASETLATVTGRGATTSTAVIINNNLAVNTASPYATGTYSLDINGGLLVKNTGRASNITLINSDPAGGGNHAFVIHTVSGTLGSSLVDIQGYYGANVTGSTTIRLNPLGGNVTINGYTAYHAGNIPTLNQSTTGNAATASNATNLSGLGTIQSTSVGTSYQNNYQVRENSGGSGNTNEIYAPQLGFHWSGIVASSIMMEASGRIAIRNNPGGSYENFVANVIYANSSFQGNLTGNVTGNVSGTALNITQYTINQSVGTGNGPTFAGLTVNTGGVSTWGPFVVNSTSLWGDGATLYATIGAGGAAGIMIYNPHIVWNSGNSCAGIRLGRSGGTSAGKYYEIGTGANDNFFIAKESLASGTQLNINSSGNATFSGTITASNFSGSHSGSSSGTNTGDQTNISGNAATATTASDVAWSNVSSKPASWLNAGALVAEIAPSATAFPSGFYQSYLGAGNPTGTWFNYINVRHSNTGNGHGYQLGMSYYDNILWFRSYQGSTEPTFQSWAYAISSQNIGSQSVSYAATAGSATDSSKLPTAGGTMTGQITWSSGTAPISFQQGGNSGTYTQTTIYANQNNTSGDDGNGIFIERGYTNTSNTEIRRFIIGVRGGSVQWRLDGPGNVTQTGGLTATYLTTSGDGNFGPDSGGDNGIRIRYGGGSSDYGRIRFMQAGTNNQTIHTFSTNWQGGSFVSASAGAININGSNGVTFGGWNNVDGYISTGGTAWFRADVTAYSDARVKENIRPIENALQKVINSRGVLYDRIDSGTKNNIGFIAQELEVNLPELIMTDSEDLKSVKYQNMTAVLVEAIKEQQAQIEEMKKEIKELKNK